MRENLLGPPTEGTAAASVRHVESPLRLVVAEDQALVREGIIRMLESAGLTVVGVAADAVDLVAQARDHQPDVVITDIQMPPGRSDDGLRAAVEIREQFPAMGVIVLSQFLEDQFVLDLVGERADGVGYLLKERVADRTTLLDAVRSVAAGQSALDRDVIARLVGRRRTDSPLDDLTPRERRVLALMAEGRSNTGIADVLTITVPTVERHVSGIFTKLGLLPSEAESHRRVVAVLKYLQR